jgi:hypothetical protein
VTLRADDDDDEPDPGWLGTDTEERTGGGGIETKDNDD